jgi:hypothetical protein
MKMSTDLSIILTRSVKSFGFEIIYRVSSLSNIEKGLDLLKKYFDSTIPTTLITQKAHKGDPVYCTEFRIVEYLKRTRREGDILISLIRLSVLLMAEKL